MANSLSRRELLAKAVGGRRLLLPPRLTLDRGRCTGCGLCARDCPRQAITMSGEFHVQIAFSAERCDACGACVELCPEKCLRLDTGASQTGPTVLFEDDLVSCARCGATIGPKSMVKRITAALGQARAPDVALCPACKGADCG